MLRIRQGDGAAFEVLYRKYLSSVTAFATALGGREVSVADVVQETFARLWDRRQEYRGEASVRTYIFAYVRNICLEERRHRRRTQVLSQHLSLDSSCGGVASLTPETATYLREMNEVLEQALAKLDDAQEQALRLYHIEGMSLHEAATSAGCTQKCFESRLSRGRARLRYLLLHSDRHRRGR